MFLFPYFEALWCEPLSTAGFDSRGVVLILYHFILFGLHLMLRNRRDTDRKHSMKLSSNS